MVSIPVPGRLRPLTCYSNLLSDHVVHQCRLSYIRPSDNGGIAGFKLFHFSKIPLQGVKPLAVRCVFQAPLMDCVNSRHNAVSVFRISDTMPSDDLQRGFDMIEAFFFLFDSRFASDDTDAPAFQHCLRHPGKRPISSSSAVSISLRKPACQPV